ncbi:mycothione reductase [Dietzia sp.]|uniref:mycothione reductase n=1 Tax=Dietzia sp. TaxID=1871616 RepID=UPI002FDB5B3B
MSQPQVDEHFDIIIIGTGSGNSLPGDEIDDKKIAICEEWTFGGTCLNRGCIPTKMFVFAADQAENAATNARLGIDTSYQGVRWSDIVSRVFDDRVDLIAAGGEAYRRNECENITVFDGHARFVGPRTIDTGTGKIISADQILLAAGARASVPDAVRESGVPFHTSDDIMRIAEPPESIVILGSGYIATEFAHIFSAFGTRVTVIGRSPVLLKHLDSTISEAFTDAAREKWDVRLGQATTGFSSSDDGRHIHVDFADGSTADGDMLLVATGRVPNGDLMDLGEGGIEIDSTTGSVRTDEYGRTSAEGVWAIGDISSPYQLKHVANHELRVVRHNMLHPEDLAAFNHGVVPYAVFSSPQVAAAGLTEDEALEAGYDVTVKVQEYGDVAYGWAMVDPVGVVKLVADKDSGRLLGAHIVGHEASIIIQPLVQAMTFGLGVQEMARGQYWIHPALTEVVENALLGLGFPDRGF